MEDLEIHYDPTTKISEAPLQLKSNLGTFLIDDFGRQRMQPIELLNRWIVPLEKRYDFLSLANGKKIRVPFDQLILFSTNLEPKDLVDEAFLRRIPYKINAADPTEPMFRKMIELFAPKLGFREVDQSAVDYLIDRHYKSVRPSVPLLPAPRPAAPGQELLRLQRPAPGAEARVLRLRRPQLFHGDVSDDLGVLSEPGRPAVRRSGEVGRPRHNLSRIAGRSRLLQGDRGGGPLL